MKSKILWNSGEEVLLSPMENHQAMFLNRQIKERFGSPAGFGVNQLANALGFEIDVTTLTTIVKKVTEQKFFEIAPADYLPVRVGEGAWSSNLVTYRAYQLGDDFTTGLINTGANNDRLAGADAGVDSVTVKVYNWAKSIGWALPDLELAARSGNWDLVTAKEKARKRNWDLGIQKIAFLGIKGDSNCLGFYTQAGITNDTTTIPQPISSLSDIDFKAFCAAVINAYRSNCNRTAWPTHFTIPESDYLGLSAQASASFPIKSMLQVLEETFATATKKKDFKILPNAYGDAAYNTIGGASGTTRYVLHNYDEESVRMDLPVDYTNTLANSLDNFNFQNAAYGQFTGVMSYRPAEMLYFSIPA